MVSVSDRLDADLFGESGARIIVSISPRHEDAFIAHLAAVLGDDWEFLGTVGGDSLQIDTPAGESLITLDLTPMTASWSQSIERRLAV